MTMSKYEMKMKIIREVHYDSQKMFGIYATMPSEYNMELKKNKYNNVALQGNVRRLKVGDEFHMEFEGAHEHPRYGFYYKIIEVEPERLESIEEQSNFLSSILTENQYNSLKEAYPNDKLVDLILEDKIDTSLTKGIKEKSLEKIKEEVQRNSHISVLIAKLNELDLSVNAIDRLLGHFKTSQKCIEAIEESIYKLCEVPSFGFKTVDKIAMRRGDNPTNNERISACIRYLVEKNMDDGHSWCYIDDILHAATEELNINDKFVLEVLEDLKKEDEYYFDDKRIAKRFAREMELEVYKNLKRISDNYISPSIDNMQEKIKEVEEYQGFKFTDEQRKAVLEGSQHGVMIVNGLAGSGKTGTVKGLIDSLGVDSYMACALSGSAVKVLSKRGINSSTIHRMLSFKDGEFYFGEGNKLPYDLIVIDEMSMIGIPLFLSVLRAVEKGTKLILVGDSGQLPPIDFGHPLENLLHTSKFPSYELTKVHRQAKKSGILSLASSVRSGGQPMPYNSSGSETYGELKDQTIIGYNKESKGNIPYDVLRIAENYSKTHVSSPVDLLDFQVVVAIRNSGDLSVRSMNVELQRVFNDVNKEYLSRNGYDFRVGDKVIIRGNSYSKEIFNSEKSFIDYLDLVDMVGEEEAKDTVPNKTNVFNGTVGFVSSIAGKHVLIQFDDISGLVAFKQSDDMDKLDLGYAATVHQLQGSGIKNIVFCLDYSAYVLLSKQLIYTGITRAVDKSVMLVETNALHSAIKNDISGARRTFLPECIVEELQ